MKILVVGGTGIIGSAIVSQLKESHEVIAVGRSNGDYQVDIESKDSIEQLLKSVGPVDGIISTTGGAGMGPFHTHSDEAIAFSINSKLKGQMDLIRLGVHHVKDNGFIIVTSGSATHEFMPGASLVTMTNAGIEGYVRAINVEQYKGIRINAVSPSLVEESAKLYNFDIEHTIPAADTASVYKMLIESDESGIVVDVRGHLNKKEDNNMSVRETIKKQIINHLKGAEFPIATPEALLGAFPNGADTVCKAGDLVVTAGEAGTLLKANHFPFSSAEEVGETIVELAGL